MTPPAADTNEPVPKRIRLNLACNQCRKRKVRCDAETPKCRNCWLRDEDCETTDPRRPEAGQSVRKWATKDGLLPGQNPAATHQNQAYVPKHINNHNAASASHGSNSDTPMPAYRTPPVAASGLEAAGIPSASHEQPSTLRTQSWVSKAYQHSMQEQDHHGHGKERIPEHPDVVINTDEDESYKIKYLGGSSLQCLTVFLDMHLQQRRLQTVAPCFRGGMRYAEEFDLPLAVTIPNLPPYYTVAKYFDTFFTTIWPFTPVVDQAAVVADYTRLEHKQGLHPGGLKKLLSIQDAAPVVSILAILCIGADEMEGGATDMGKAYLTAAYSLYGALMAHPYLSSIQALVLLGVAMRGKSKDGQCWQLTGQAIRVAHSIGLHRHLSASHPTFASSISVNLANSDSDHLPLEARVWWSCYALERLMELETGRPSVITEHEIDQIRTPPPPAWPPLSSLDDPAAEAPMTDNSHEEINTTTPLKFFTLWVSLARIMGQISELIYRKRTYGPGHLLYETGKLDQLLLAWVNSVPQGLRPGQHHDMMQHPQHIHIASFLSLQYYQAQITLFRACMVFPTRTFLDEIRRQSQSSESPQVTPPLPVHLRDRLLQSQGICTAAARAMAHQVLEMADDDIALSQHLSTPTQPFLAAVALALHILKNPAKRMVRSDVELLRGTTEHVEAVYRALGQTPQFVEGCRRLREGVVTAVESRQSSGKISHVPPRRSDASGASGTTPSQAMTSMVLASPASQASAASAQEHAFVASRNTEMGTETSTQIAIDAAYSLEPYESVSLEEMWYSMSSDFFLGDLDHSIQQQ